MWRGGAWSGERGLDGLTSLKNTKSKYQKKTWLFYGQADHRGWPPQNGNIPFENLLPPRKLLLLDTCATLKLTTRKDWSLVKFNWISLFPSCRCSASAMIQLCAGDGWWSNSTTAGRRSARCAARCFARLVTHCLSYDTVPVPTVH